MNWRVNMASDAAGSTVLKGYAARFNSRTNIAGEFMEEIAPGAFAKSLAERDIIALWHHDTARVLGRTSSGTLKLWEDSRGLAFELDCDPSTPDGATALGLVGRKDVKGCSFAFRVLAEAWHDAKPLPVRRLEEVELIEITLTGFPAYPDTSVSLRSASVSGRALAARLRMEWAMRERGLHA